MSRDWIAEHREYVERCLDDDFPEMSLRHLGMVVMMRLYEIGTEKAEKELMLMTDAALAIERDCRSDRRAVEGRAESGEGGE